ncbi:MAG: RluA family pseudouridine synthase [Clostridia bacterium]|nr:RluA family pseudouridine synthase [Clostridia bacterium]
MEEKWIEAVTDGRRLDVLLAEAAGLSRSRAAALMEEGQCFLEGAPCRKAGERPTPGKRVTLTVPAPRETGLAAEDLPLEILYEDPDLAVVNKPRGMVVHPAVGHEEGTLVNALLFRLDSLGAIGGERRPGIVHRLDKDTSGLLLVAKNDETQQALSDLLRERRIEKHYRALAEGLLKEDAGRIEAPIGRSRKDRKKMAVDPAGREAITEWRKLAEGRSCTLLDVHILTGRTHQIRVHLKSIHHPVCGDPLYGSDRGAKVPCLMLHARSLTLEHPRTHKKMTFQAPLPEDFLKGLGSNGIVIPEELI